MARIPITGRYEQVEKITGRLIELEDCWSIDGKTFKCDSRRNSWIVKLLRGWANLGQRVEVSEGLLLSVRNK